MPKNYLTFQSVVEVGCKEIHNQVSVKVRLGLVSCNSGGLSFVELTTERGNAWKLSRRAGLTAARRGTETR